MSARRVLVAEPLGDEGMALLRAEPELEVDAADAAISAAELPGRLAGADALIVRSATKVTAAVLAEAKRLRVVVRAGAGVDNIDVPAATARGIVVMNTPGGNSIAAAEHTMALLLAVARHIPAANQSLREGRWEREAFVGWELSQKVLGLAGLGRVGSEVAARARAFGMEVLAYDPYIASDAAASRGIRLVALDELFATSDVVSLHLPLADATRHMVDAARLARMKPGACLVNCARGGLIDEQALLEALEKGTVAGAALDVFEGEPKPLPLLIAHPRVVATPHLGASTEEAQASVGIQAARQVIGVLDGTSFENALNVPIRDAALLGKLGPWLRLAERMAALQMQIVEGGVREVALEIAGDFAETAPLVLSYLKGLLSRMVGSAAVNYVNATLLARERGIRVTESRAPSPMDYNCLLTATVTTDRERHSARGTVIAGDKPRLVEIDGFHIDAIPEGNLLVCKSHDRPGAIGQIGTCCGTHGLNISEFRLGRSGPGGEALSVITLDQPATEAALADLRRIPHVVWVKSVAL